MGSIQHAQLPEGALAALGPEAAQDVTICARKSCSKDTRLMNISHNLKMDSEPCKYFLRSHWSLILGALKPNNSWWANAKSREVLVGPLRVESEEVIGGPSPGHQPLAWRFFIFYI